MIGLLCYHYFIFNLTPPDPPQSIPVISPIIQLFDIYSVGWGVSLSVIVLVLKRRNLFKLSNIGRTEVINAKSGGWRCTTANKIGLTK